MKMRRRNWFLVAGLSLLVGILSAFSFFVDWIDQEVQNDHYRRLETGKLTGQHIGLTGTSKFR
jgi:hypothetical protein